ncbi:MAG: hypothetical protein ACM3XO_28980 [Bacteroidota bacterium]
MPGKPNSHKWNDVQTAIATVAIVTTLGLWNLFATPSKVAKTTQVSEPVLPPPTEPPVVDSAPTAMPYVKVIFTPGAVQTTVIQPVQQPLQQQVQQTVKKKKNRNTSTTSVSVTKTKTS